MQAFYFIMEHIVALILNFARQQSPPEIWLLARRQATQCEAYTYPQAIGVD